MKTFTSLSALLGLVAFGWCLLIIGHHRFAVTAVPNKNGVVTSSFYDGGEGDGTVGLPITTRSSYDGGNGTTTVGYPSSSLGVATCIPTTYISKLVSPAERNHYHSPAERNQYYCRSHPTYTITYIGCDPPDGNYTIVPGGTPTGNYSFPSSPSISNNALSVEGDSGGAIKSSSGAAGVLAVILAAIAL